MTSLYASHTEALYILRLAGSVHTEASNACLFRAVPKFKQVPKSYFIRTYLAHSFHLTFIFLSSHFLQALNSARETCTKV